jgi:N-acetylglucosamine malate deacetylase 2
MDPLAPLLGRTLVLIAHPDDEAVGCGALLQRMEKPIVVFATDGAPRDDYFWKVHGSRLRYARLRQEEARAGLAEVGVSEIVWLQDIAGDFDLFIDQELHHSIPQAISQLRALIARYRPNALLTLAYEGGHPDHDTCNFLISLLAAQHSLPAWEMPLYFRAQPGERAFQQFMETNGTEITLEPTAEEIEAKRRLLAAYGSQSHFLTSFAEAVEQFRPLPAYDYTRPPHPGLLNYEAWEWPITGQQVADSFTAYLNRRGEAGGR